MVIIDDASFTDQTMLTAICFNTSTIETYIFIILMLNILLDLIYSKCFICELGFKKRGEWKYKSKNQVH